MWLCKNVSGKYKIKLVVIGNAKRKHNFTDAEADGTLVHYYSQKGARMNKDISCVHKNLISGI
jgi:hypothetical protein